ncbi:acyltransferase [Peribacillus simplex]|uniref:acyltransferase family protein n=1 Tax=Peribacillus simplex TaxID=1478 RepID=UPI002E1D4C07|nr:acyltransferase [Peribacillus simplex]MED4094017.1 acyltransferase [Peribacillus simplex]
MTRYEEFDSLRGLAALIVLIGHYLMVYPSYANYQYDSNSSHLIYLFKETPLRLFFSSGNESVILFFVLSGFVLYLSVNSAKFHYSTYLIKRVFRIYIPYLVAISVAILSKMLLSHIDLPYITNWFSKSWTSQDTPSLLIEHLLFIGQYNTDAYNNVIWSLVHEMRISIVFPLLIFLFVRKKLKYSLLWLFVLIFSSTFCLYLVGSSVDITSILLSFHYSTLFLMGAILAKYRHELFAYTLKMKKTVKIVLLLGAIICFMYEGIIGEVDFLNNYIFRDYVVSCGVCMFIIMSVCSQKVSTILRSRMLTLLGNISYSLYLYHLISLFSLMYLFYNKLPTGLILIFSFFLSFLLSSVSYLFVEKPCMKLGSYLTRNKQKTVITKDPIALKRKIG